MSVTRPTSSETRPAPFKLTQPLSQRFTTPFKEDVAYTGQCVECELGPSGRNKDTYRLKITFRSENPLTGNPWYCWHTMQWSEAGIAQGLSDLQNLLTGMLGAEAPELAQWFSESGELLPAFQTALDSGSLHTLLVGNPGNPNSYEWMGRVRTDKTGNRQFQIVDISPIHTPATSPSASQLTNPDDSGSF